MRPIEFRAWDKKAKVMVCPVVVYETQDHIGFSEETFRKCYNLNEYYEHLEVGDDWYYLFDDKVMQYTGVEDLNTRRIFEDDIVRDGEGALYSVEFMMGKGLFFLRSFEDDEYNCTMTMVPVTVIGNIWENKKLLKEKFGF